MAAGDRATESVTQHVGGHEELAVVVSKKNMATSIRRNNSEKRKSGGGCGAAACGHYGAISSRVMVRDLFSQQGALHLCLRHYSSHRRLNSAVLCYSGVGTALVTRALCAATAVPSLGVATVTAYRLACSRCAKRRTTTAT